MAEWRSKIPLQLLEEQELFRDCGVVCACGVWLVGWFWEDGGRKAAGKKTKVRKSFLHLRLEIARGRSELLTAALSCLDRFAQVESRESSTV